MPSNSDRDKEGERIIGFQNLLSPSEEIEQSYLKVISTRAFHVTNYALVLVHGGNEKKKREKI